MPWFLAWRGGVYGLVAWKVRVLCQLWPNCEVPSRGESRAVPHELLDTAPLVNGTTRESLSPMDGGGFLSKVYDNWTDEKRPKTGLRPEEKAVIEGMPWFLAWRGGVSGLVAWKVRVLCKLWPSREVPKKKNRRPVPPELLEIAPLVNGASPESLVHMDGGVFLRNVYNNWTDGKKPMTLLQPEEKAVIEGMPWFSAWRGVEYGLVAWQVRVLCQLWPIHQVPKNGDCRPVPHELLNTAPLVNGATRETLAHMDGGRFLESVYDNWTDGKQAATPLRPREKAAIKRMPWFSAWRNRMKRRTPDATETRSVRSRTDSHESGAVTTATESGAAADFQPSPAPPLLPPIHALHQVHTEGRVEPMHLMCGSAAPTAVANPVTHPMRGSTAPTAVANPVMHPMHSTPPSVGLQLAPPETSPTQAGYDAALFTAEHRAFKDECTAVFVGNLLDRCLPNCNVAFLDDFDGVPCDRGDASGEGKAAMHLRTSRALLVAGVAPGRLYLANPNAAICRRLAAYSAETHAACCLFDAALAQQWTGVRFGALYLDLCTGSSDVVLENMEAAMPQLERRCLLGFTFTRRDRSGGTAVERQYRIDGFLRDHGFERVPHVGLLVHAAAGAYTQFYARGDVA